MTDNNDTLQFFKEALEKEHNRVFTDREVKKAFDILSFFAEVAIDVTLQDHTRKKKLQDHPNGFHLEGAHTCEICRTICYDESSWYDEYGIKCVTCQAAVNKKIIQPALPKLRDSYYTPYDLEHCFNVDKHLLKNWMKKGFIKARIITKGERGTHFMLFLTKDNKDFLPPKKLVESACIINEVNGKKEYIFPVPWYQLCNDPLKRIEKYGIAAHLATTEM